VSKFRSGNAPSFMLHREYVLSEVIHAAAPKGGGNCSSSGNSSSSSSSSSNAISDRKRRSSAGNNTASESKRRHSAGSVGSSDYSDRASEQLQRRQQLKDDSFSHFVRYLEDHTVHKHNTRERDLLLERGQAQ
jgi:hypothetical protein